MKKQFIKRFKNFKREAKKLANMEVKEAIKLGASKLHTQVKIRPRARLFAKFLLVMTVAFLISGKGARVLAQKKADIKINGQAILVAKDSQPTTDEVDIVQTIEPKRSPFEFSKAVDGYISQDFSSYHRAIDIAAPFGSPIHPVGSGIIEFAGQVYDGHGNMVIIDHGDGLKSTYSHMDKIYVGVGNMVSAGTVIGTIGMTGRTTGPHVHLEIIDNGTMVDPAAILP